MFHHPRSGAIALGFAAPLIIAGGLALHGRPAPTPAVRASLVTVSASPTAAPLATATPVVITVTPVARPPTKVLAMFVNQDPLFAVRAKRGGPSVREAPNDTARLLTGLYYDTYLQVFDQKKDAAGTLWYQVRLWGVLPGWIRADQTETGDPPTPTPRPASPSAPRPPRPSRSAVLPLNARGVTTDWVNFRTGSSVTSEKIDVLPPGTSFDVQAWQTDEDASAWYRVSASGRIGWVWSGATNLPSPSPSKVTVSGKPVWSSIEGKGMWMPVPLLEMADPTAVVEAASELGITHIYLEVGSSGGGFYGKAGVDRLLPVAHKAGIKVVGWLLTGLNDLPADVALCARVANYKTPSGDQLDGIAPDIEDNMNGTDVGAFAQILRAEVGANRLIVGVIFPAGSWIGQQHPVAQILSRSFNALAPMAYWHESRKDFSGDVVANYIRHAVVDIHAAVGDPRYPVAVIGQTYDSFSRNGAGPNNPTHAEITAALDSAKRSGAVGVSLFQWGTTTPPEWDALRAFKWAGES